MRLALAFRRPDVDQFLDELTHEQYVEWHAYLAENPTDWDAFSILGTRLTYAIFQSASGKKKLREKNYRLSLAPTVSSPVVASARAEANAIRHEIANAKQHG